MVGIALYSSHDHRFRSTIYKIPTGMTHRGSYPGSTFITHSRYPYPARGYGFPPGTGTGMPGGTPGYIHANPYLWRCLGEATACEELAWGLGG